MAEDAPPALIALDDVDESALVRIDGTDPKRVVAEVRDAVAAGHTVVVTPDAAADDRDAWIALVSVAVVEGAEAVETSHPGEARRILDMYRAIVTGGAELEP